MILLTLQSCVGSKNCGLRYSDLVIVAQTSSQFFLELIRLLCQRLVIAPEPSKALLDVSR